MFVVGKGCWLVRKGYWPPIPSKTTREPTKSTNLAEGIQQRDVQMVLVASQPAR